MKEIPITSKNVFGLVSFIIMAFGFTFLFYHFGITIKDKPAEEEVEVKYTQKGLYIYPRYKIQVTNSDEPSTVTKEQFELIESGDTISGYMKNEDSFVTDKDVQFEKSLGIPILLFLYLGVLALGGGLLKSTKFFKNKVTRKNKLLKMIKGVTLALLYLYFITGLVFIGIVATNLFHKVNKSNQTEVTAIVLDSEDEENLIPYRAIRYSSYELLLAYQDKEGEQHITNRAVSSATYNKYNPGDSIKLRYRNNNVYDTFIVTEDTDEIISPFFSMQTFMLGFYIATVFVIIRAWRKRKRKQLEEG